MKKVLAAALCGAVMFLLPGCGGERLPYAREMGDMALMRTMGVDTGEGGAEQLHVTVSSGRRARGLQGRRSRPWSSLRSGSLSAAPAWPCRG